MECTKQHCQIFSGYFALSGTITTAAQTNGNYTATNTANSNAWLGQSAAVSSSIEASFSVSMPPSNGINLATIQFGIWACDSTNNKLYQISTNTQNQYINYVQFETTL